MKQNTTPIAVVGINALFPGSVDKHMFWRNILEGNDLIADVPETHFSIADYFDENPGEQDKVYNTRGGFLPEIPFDPMEFAIPPGSLQATDTSQLLSLRVAKQVLEEAANGQFSEMDREKISVILGVTSASELVVDLSARTQRPVWVKALRESGVPEDQVQQISDRIADHYVPWQEGSFPGLLGNVVAGRIANRLNLGGSNLVTDAACASSLSAVSMAIMELSTYQSDLVITGGADTMNNIFMYMCFTKTPALSRTGDCRPFSEDADGTVLGEGIGMVALKRLEDAERDHDPIYAVIRGYGTSSDGSAKSVYAPNPIGQAKALRRTYDMAGYGPDTVELMEAHGTGTKAGDLAEFEALRTVFNESKRADRNWCALGSVKSQIGHTKAAAGAAGLFKAVMALHHKILPPTIKVDQPNPKLHIDESPFYINSEARPWIANPNYPRRASLSAFGFGGSNFHLTLEEYRGKTKKAYRVRNTANELFVFSADNAELLIEKCEQLRFQIQQGEDEERLEQWARTTHEQHKVKSARLAIVASSKEDAIRKLDQACEHLLNGETRFEANGLHGWIDSRDGKSASPKVAFLFPGQGSQYTNMMKQLTMEFDDLRHIWDQLATDKPLSQLPHIVYPKPVFTTEARNEQRDKLSSIEWTQPAIGAASLVGYHFLKKLGIQPDAVGGHSYGEITALCAAGVYDDQTMLEIARKRALFMKQAADSEHESGTMTAVFYNAELLQEWIQQAGMGVVLANVNAPEQCVISGKVKDVEQAETFLAERGVRYQRLSVAGAFHSPLVASASESFMSYLQGVKFSSQQVPVFSNDEGNLFNKQAEFVKEQLAQQIAKPVHFVKQIERMAEQGITVFLEVGPSSVLSGLVPQVATNLENTEIHSLTLDKKGVHGLEQAYHTLAQLFVLGVEMDLSSLWEGIEPLQNSQEDRAKRAKRMDIRISGANYGKPYPTKTGNAADAKKLEELDAPPTVNRNESISQTVAQQEFIDSEPVHIKYQGGIEMNQSMAEAHAMYLKMMSENHTLFLRAAAQAPLPESEVHAGVQMLQPQWQPTAGLVESELSVPAMPPSAPAPIQTIAPPIQAPAHIEIAASAQEVEAAAPSSQDTASVKDMLLEIVSEKTGYPADMLDLEADLESGLGIDSIKRVEIFAAMQENVSGLPQLDPDQISGLHTLLEIEQFIQGLLSKKKEIA